MIGESSFALEIIFLIYGLAFFMLGVIVLLLPRGNSSMPFTKHLEWLAGFGILHGLLEFVTGLSLNCFSIRSPHLALSCS